MTGPVLDSTTVEVWQSFDQIPLSAWAEAGGAPSVFMTPGWQRAWWEALGHGDLLIVTVSEAGRVVVIAPLFVTGGMAFFVGSGSADYLDIVASRLDPPLVRLVLQTAASQIEDFVGFRLHHVPDHSVTGKLLASVAPDLGLHCFDEGWLDAPFMDARAQGLSAATSKKSLVRHERWFRAHGQLLVEHLTAEEDVAPHLSAFFDQHTRRWAETPHPSLFANADQRHLFQRLVHHGGSEGWLRFTRVVWEGAPVAFHLGFCHRSSFLWYKPSFEPELAQRSPGEVLLRQLLLAAEGERVQRFDFGLGTEAFKSRFADQAARVRTYGLYPSAVL